MKIVSTDKNESRNIGICSNYNNNNNNNNKFMNLYNYSLQIAHTVGKHCRTLYCTVVQQPDKHGTLNTALYGKDLGTDKHHIRCCPFHT